MPNQSTYTFSGHQTFPFRYTWLPKLVRRTAADNTAFFSEQVLETFGVGRNMVMSMRYWGEALGLAEFDTRQGTAVPSDLGTRIFGDGGWDPYLEDPATLWLLHWQLARAAERASTWYLVFNRWNKDRFTRDELVAWVRAVAEQTASKRISVDTIKRDVDVFLRTYTPTEVQGKRLLEDSFDCPLVDLALVQEAERGLFLFRRAARPTLPVAVFAYAVSEYWARHADSQATLNLERVLYDPGSPGAVFRLSETAAVSLAELLPSWTGMRYDETAGMRLLMRTTPAPDRFVFLHHHFAAANAGAAA